VKIIRKAIRGIPHVRLYPDQLPAPHSGRSRTKSATRVPARAVR
jgi:hypothetical protein